MGRDISLDEVIEHFTLDGDEKELLRNKAGGRLGFAMMLKYLLWRGRFPRGRHEIPDDAIAHVARQIGVSAGDMGFYDVVSRQARNHRAEIRGHTGFRVCTVADADKLALWLAGGVARDGRSAAELGVRQRPVFVREADPGVQLGVARQPAVQARHPNKHKADASTVVVVAQQFQADGLDPVGLVHDEQLGVVAGAL